MGPLGFEPRSPAVSNPFSATLVFGLSLLTSSLGKGLPEAGIMAKLYHGPAQLPDYKANFVLEGLYIRVKAGEGFKLFSPIKSS